MSDHERLKSSAMDLKRSASPSAGTRSPLMISPEQLERLADGIMRQADGSFAIARRMWWVMAVVLFGSLVDVVGAILVSVEIRSFREDATAMRERTNLVLRAVSEAQRAQALKMEAERAFEDLPGKGAAAGREVEQKLVNAERAAVQAQVSALTAQAEVALDPTAKQAARRELAAVQQRVAPVPKEKETEKKLEDGGPW